VPDLSPQKHANGKNQEQVTTIPLVIKDNMVFLLILTIYLFLLLWDINEPWVGIHDFNGAFFGTLVKDVLKNTDFNHLFSYWHHPPLFQILLFYFCQVFGTSEVSFRSVPILFSLGNIILLYLIVLEEVADKRIAEISVILFAFMPMTAYYGRMVAHESGSMFFILLTFYLYLKHTKSLTKKTLLATYSSFILGTLIGWPGYYVFIAIFLHVLFYHRNKRMLIKTAIIFLLGVLSFYFTLASLSHFSATTWEKVFQELIKKGEVRSQSTVSISEFVTLEFERLVGLFGVVILLTFFIFIYTTGYSIFRTVKEKSFQIHAIFQEILKKRVLILSLLFLLLGTTHILLFIQGAYVHEYWMFYLTIGFIIPCAAIISKQNREFKQALIIFYILISLYTLYNMHKTDDTIFYEIGTYIDEHTDPENYVFVPLPQIGYYTDCNYYLIQIGTNRTAQRLYDAIRQHNQKGNPIQFVVLAEWLAYKEEMDTVLVNAGFTMNKWGKDFRVYNNTI